MALIDWRQSGRACHSQCALGVCGDLLPIVRSQGSGTLYAETCRWGKHMDCRSDFWTHANLGVQPRTCSWTARKRRPELLDIVLSAR